MKTALIIPIYNQRKYWFKMMNAIEQQTELPDIVYVILDRQTDDDYRFIKSVTEKSKINYKVFNFLDIPDYVPRTNEEPDEPLFLVGYRRNQGINIAIEDGCTCFVMIDGDCIPDKDLIKSHKFPNSFGIPNVSNGRRREDKHGDKDQREVDPKIKGLNLFNENKKINVIRDYNLLKSCSVVWSCNMSMNLNAVNLIKSANLKYYGRDEVFNSTFLGSWGAEDSFLGIQAFYLNIFTTVLTDEFSGIRHIDHPRPEKKYGEKSFSEILLKEIEYFHMCLQIDPLEYEIYTKSFNIQ